MSRAESARLDLAQRAAQIQALPSLATLVRSFELRPSKALGQNFLLDLNLTGKIARAALAANGGRRTGTTIEIGPGPGGLTRALLLEDFTHVVAIEKDHRAVGLLDSLRQAAMGTLEVVEGDALALDPTTLGPPPHRIVANLPYNIGTALVTGWLTQIAARPSAYDSLSVMLQREVAQRLVAKPGDKAFGRLGVLAGWLCHTAIAFEVPATAFVPPPKVTSAVVTLVPRARDARPFDADPAALGAVTAALFGQRRKMIRQAIKALGGEGLDILAASGVEPTKRAEALSLDEFGRLAQLYGERSPKG